MTLTACICCTRTLRPEEPQTCARCIARTRADLADVEYAFVMLDPVIRVAGYRSGTLPGGDALVYRGDGSLESPQTPNQYTEPLIVGPTVHLERPDIDGHTDPVPWWKLNRANGTWYREVYAATTAHPAYIEERIPPDGREHVRDHWPSDPTPVIAVLETWQRDWRLTFRQPPGDELVTVTSAMAYLNRNLDRAANTHPAFDEFATEIRSLRWRLAHVAGVADDPLEGVECFEIIDGVKCTGTIVRPYNTPRREAQANVRRAARLLSRTLVDRRIQQVGRKLEQVAAIKRGDDPPPSIPDLTVDEQRAVILPKLEGDDTDGLAVNWECQRCDRVYEPQEYYLAVRAALEAAATIAQAAVG